MLPPYIYEYPWRKNRFVDFHLVLQKLKNPEFCSQWMDNFETNIGWFLKTNASSFEKHAFQLHHWNWNVVHSSLMDKIDSPIRLAKHMLGSPVFCQPIGGVPGVKGVGRHFVDEGLCFFPSKAWGRYVLEPIRLNPLEIVEDSVIKITHW